MSGLINRSNLDEKSLTNAEVLALLSELSTTVYQESFSRVLDAVEDLTGDRNFEDSKVDEAVKSLSLKVIKGSIV